MGQIDLEIAKPLTLPCGLKLPNRLAKAALSESWADRTTLMPSEKLLQIYELWAEGNWGMVITSNVQIDSAYMGTPEDNAFNDSLSREEHLASWTRWANVIKKSGTPAIMQLNHPGRQSTIGAGSRSYFAKSIAPSAVPVQLGPGYIARAASAFVFGTPRAMTRYEIEDVIARFAKTATMAFRAGFQGVQIHGAHGYLLTQFLSSRTNHRSDSYGGSPKKRAKIVVDVIGAIRAAVPKEFCVGIKINSVDHQSSSELEECLEQLTAIIDAGVDFIEISGGNYEEPAMLASTAGYDTGKVSASTAAREAFFLEFAKTIRKTFPEVCLMVTGGFRSRLGMEQAVESGACDLVGLGRPAILDPKFPKTVALNSKVMDNDARLQTKSFSRPWLAAALGIKGLGGGAETLGYVAEIHRMLK